MRKNRYRGVGRTKGDMNQGWGDEKRVRVRDSYPLNKNDGVHRWESGVVSTEDKIVMVVRQRGVGGVEDKTPCIAGQMRRFQHDEAS